MTYSIHPSFYSNGEINYAVRDGDNDFLAEFENDAHGAVDYIKARIEEDKQKLVDNTMKMMARAYIEDLRRDNRKIDAIKRVRSLSNMGLKEAKDLVEALWAE